MLEVVHAHPDAARLIPLLAVRAVHGVDAPITSNPSPEPIVRRGITVHNEVKDIARLPDTHG
jgi:hypothetical protein